MTPTLPNNQRPRCNFLTCLAGMGVAGTGNCFLHGEPDNPECPKYKNEKEWENNNKRSQIR